jgi:hypothetical protein
VKDGNGQQIAYLYFEDEPQRQMSMKRLSRDEAFLIALNIAKLPSVPRQILKDISRPPKYGWPGRLKSADPPPGALLTRQSTYATLTLGFDWRFLTWRRRLRAAVEARLQ